MAPDEQELKDEVQGDGFLQKVKKEKIPDSTEMSERAIEKYEENNGHLSETQVHEDFSEILMSLIETETTIFNVRRDEVYPNALSVFLDKQYQTGQVGMSSFANDEDGDQYVEYPEMQSTMNEISDIFDSYDDFEEVFKRVFPKVYILMRPIVESERQSAGKRAGLGFKNHFEYLLSKAGFEIKNETARDNGYILDISEGHGTTQAMYFGFHTTLKDRYRATFSDAPRDLPKFLITGSGARIYSEDDTEDITSEKLSSIADEGFTLVAIEQEAEKYKERDHIISYETLINERLLEVLS